MSTSLLRVAGGTLALSLAAAGIAFAAIKISPGTSIKLHAPIGMRTEGPIYESYFKVRLGAKRGTSGTCELKFGNGAQSEIVRIEVVK